MNRKHYLTSGLILIYFISMFSGCTRTVTRYKFETRPVEVTKYRVEKRPVQKEGDVPYEVEEKVPVYKKVSKSKVNSGTARMPIAFFPFTYSAGMQNQAEALSSSIVKSIKKQPEYPQKFKIIEQNQIERLLNKSDLSVLSKEEIGRITSRFNLGAFVTGHLKSKAQNLCRFKLEVLDPSKMAPILVKEFNAYVDNSINSIKELFYGRYIRSGYTTKMVTKYKKGMVTVYEDVKIPYSTTEQREVSVPYKKRVASDIGKLFGNALVIGLGLLILPLLL